MQGRKSQPIPTFLDKDARPKEGFALRKSQGRVMPAAPAAAVRAMYLSDRERIWTQVSVWDCGNRQTRVGTRFAQTNPVTTSKATSELPSATGSVFGDVVFLKESVDSAFFTGDIDSRFITNCSTSSCWRLFADAVQNHAMLIE
jgi:hypothetical protein